MRKDILIKELKITSEIIDAYDNCDRNCEKCACTKYGKDLHLCTLLSDFIAFILNRLNEKN